MRLFPDHSVFEPGRVKWDNLHALEPALPLGEQESLIGCEDVLTVEYPNDVLLDVSYFRWKDPNARFVVEVVPRGDESREWTAVVERVCFSFDELKRAVLELAPIARDWKR